MIRCDVRAALKTDTFRARPESVRLRRLISTLQCAPNTAVSRHAAPTCAHSGHSPLNNPKSLQALQRNDYGTEWGRNEGYICLRDVRHSTCLQVRDAVLVHDGGEFSQRRPQLTRRTRQRQRHLHTLDASGVRSRAAGVRVRAFAIATAALLAGERFPARGRSQSDKDATSSRWSNRELQDSHTTACLSCPTWVRSAMIKEMNIVRMWKVSVRRSVVKKCAVCALYGYFTAVLS